MPEIFGVKVDKITLAQAVERVESRLKAGKTTFVVTPNPEMIMLAQKDYEFQRILNQADLAIPDGWGLRLAAPGLTRITGRDLMLAFIKKGYRTLLVGGKPGIAEKAAATISSEPEVISLSEPDINEINRIKPDLLFVALGQGKQEKWIAQHLKKLNVKLAMGVGGALDQIAKPWLVAPKWLQNLGLEWLYRLLVQPWRIRRQLALLKFLAKIYL